MEAWARGPYGNTVSFLCLSVQGQQVAEMFRSSLKLRKVVLGFVSGEMPRFGQLGCGGFVVLDHHGKLRDGRTPAFLEFGEFAFRSVESLLDVLLREVEVAVFEWPSSLSSKSARELRTVAKRAGVPVGHCLEKGDYVQAIMMHSLQKKTNGELKMLIRSKGLDASDCVERQDFLQVILDEDQVESRSQGQTQSQGEAEAMPSFESTMRCSDGVCASPIDSVEAAQAAMGNSQPSGPTSKCDGPAPPSCCNGNGCEPSFRMQLPISVGHDEMDEEHGDCVAAVNLLAEERTLVALQGVLTTFATHFANEEQQLAKNSGGTFGELGDPFSALTNHVKDHARIIARIQEIYDRSKESGACKVVGEQDLALISSLFHGHAEAFDVLYQGQL